MNSFIEQILKSINIIGLFSFIYTVWKNIQQTKLEKKTYWYRERVIKVILPFMDDLENELDNFIKSRNNENTERDELNKQMKILKEKFRQLRKKILVIKVFDKQSKDIILKDIEKIIENGENKFFNLTNDISTEASISFCNELVIKLYTYEQLGYKIKNQISASSLHLSNEFDRLACQIFPYWKRFDASPAGRYNTNIVFYSKKFF